MKCQFTRSNSLRGALIYAAGDSVAALLLGEWLWTRCLGLMLTGASLYALEIPNYFLWIEQKIAGKKGWKASIQKTVLAMAYFNPVWIARHLFFIRLFSGMTPLLSWQLLQTATWSFLVNIPISLLGNYVIQNHVPLSWRFTASAVFSGLMAVYYALSSAVF